MSPSFPFSLAVNLMLLKSVCFENFTDCREFVDQRHEEQQQLLTGRPLCYSLARRVLEVRIILSTTFLFILVMLDGKSCILMPLHFWWHKFSCQIAASAHSCSWIQMTRIQIAGVYYSNMLGKQAEWSRGSASASFYCTHIGAVFPVISSHTIYDVFDKYDWERT